MNAYHVFPFFLLFSTVLYCQNIDTNYIAIPPYKGKVYFYSTTKNNQLSFQNTLNKYTLTYYPNSWGSMGVGFTYKALDLSIGLIPYGKREESVYGKVSRIDIQSHIYVRKFIIDAFLQSYSGLYSTSGIVTSNSYKVYKRNDISISQIGGNGIYIFNHNRFSAKAAYSQSEIQKKRIGTWALGIKLNIFSVNGDSSFTSSKLDSLFKPDYRFIKFSVLQTGFLGGYLQNWLYKNWTFSITVLAGLGEQMQYKQLISDVNKTYAHATMGIIENIRISAGYSKNNFYFLLAIISDNCSYPFDNNHLLNHGFGRIDCILGYRIFNKRFNPVFIY